MSENNKYEGLYECLPKPLKAAGIVVIEGKKGHSSHAKRRKKPIKRSDAWLKKYLEV